mmetsp:Transcript_23661/g.35803  ORF Transcript_23661/g.35803 Transcript_23661/m.35803 type:complete len:239 (+) Transcript_23661:430-1146(+)
MASSRSCLWFLGSILSLRFLLIRASNTAAASGFAAYAPGRDVGLFVRHTAKCIFSLSSWSASLLSIASFVSKRDKSNCKRLPSLFNSCMSFLLLASSASGLTLELMEIALEHSFFSSSSALCDPTTFSSFLSMFNPSTTFCDSKSTLVPTRFALEISFFFPSMPWCNSSGSELSPMLSIVSSSMRRTTLSVSICDSVCPLKSLVFSLGNSISFPSDAFRVPEGDKYCSSSSISSTSVE